MSTTFGLPGEDIRSGCRRIPRPAVQMMLKTADERMC